MQRPYLDPNQHAPQFYPPPQRIVTQPMYNGNSQPQYVDQHGNPINIDANGNVSYPTTTQQIAHAGSSRSKHRHHSSSRNRSASRSHSRDPQYTYDRAPVSSNNSQYSHTLHPPNVLGHHRSSSYPEQLTVPNIGPKQRRHSHSSPTPTPAPTHAHLVPPHQLHHHGTSYAPQAAGFIPQGVQVARSAPQGQGAPIVRDYAYAQPMNANGGERKRTQSLSGYTTQIPPGTYTPIQVPNGVLAPYMPLPGMVHSSPGDGRKERGRERGRTHSTPYNPHSGSSTQAVQGTVVDRRVRYSPSPIMQGEITSQINEHPSHRYPAMSSFRPAHSSRPNTSSGVPTGTGAPAPLTGIREPFIPGKGDKALHTGIGGIDKYLALLPPSRDFCWSRCTGRKKAVCIGINYAGQKDELKGCANDARHMRDFLIKYHGFRKHDIMLLTDEQGGIDPTRKSIFDALHWLTRSAKRDDSLFFHYSGHGGQVPDKTGQEKDGMNEAIFPVDFKKTGEIIDDDLNKYLVQPLPPGCRLTAVFDSCHSGTVLDLPYLHSAHGRLRGLDHISNRARSRGAPAADVICFASCKDDETSADTFHGGIAVGAMSYAFIKVLKEHPKMNYGDLLAFLRKTLIPKYHQKAQLSTTHPLDLDKDFVL